MLANEFLKPLLECKADFEHEKTTRMGLRCLSSSLLQSLERFGNLLGIGPELGAALSSRAKISRLQHRATGGFTQRRAIERIAYISNGVQKLTGHCYQVCDNHWDSSVQSAGSQLTCSGLGLGTELGRVRAVQMSRHATDMVPEVPPSPSPPALSSPEDGVQYIAMSLQPLSEGKVELDDKAGEQPMEPNPVTTASGTGQVGLGRLEWGRQAMHAGEGAGVAGMGQDGRGTMANEAGIAQTGSPTTQHRGHEDGLEGTLGHFTHHDVLPGPSAETEDDGTARGPERKNEIDSNTTSPAGRTPPIARTSLNGHSAALAPQSSLAQDMASGQNSTDSASLVPEHAFVQPSNKHVSIVSPTPSMKMDISSPDLSNGDAFAASDKKLLPVDPADDSKQAIAVSSTVITGGPTSSVSANSTTTPSATAGIGAGTTTTWAALSSWKSRSGKTTIEKKRLRALGFEEELTREYDFWASVGLTICNIGGFPGEYDLSDISKTSVY